MRRFVRSTLALLGAAAVVVMVNMGFIASFPWSGRLLGH